MITFRGSMQVDYGDWTDQKTGRIGILLSDLWIISTGDLVAAVCMKAGFMSDGSSNPQFLWWFLPPWGDRSTIAALGHDFVTSELKAGRPVGDLTTRARCDRFYRNVLQASGINVVKRWAAWAGVRAYSILVEGMGLGRSA